MRMAVTSKAVCGQLAEDPPIVGVAAGSRAWRAVSGHQGVEPAARLFEAASGSASKLEEAVFVAKNCAFEDCADRLLRATVPEKSEAGTRVSPL